MNVGPVRKRAIAWAVSNAKIDSQPRYLTKYAGVYWLDLHAPAPGPTTGMYGSDHLIVFPDGAYQTYDPRKGVADELAQWAANRGGDQEGHDKDRPV